MAPNCVRTMTLSLLILLTISALPAAVPTASPVAAGVHSSVTSPSDDQSDLLIMKNGKEINCRVLLEGEEVVLARVGARKREFARAEIAEIQSVERSLATFFERYDALAGRGPEMLAALATYCQEMELPGEARNLWIRILVADPENEKAWTRLGGVHSKRRGWRLKVRGKFYTLEKLRERVSDWKNAMELPTAHFLLKTDIDPERALDVALNLERAYLSFYGLLGQALDLQVFDEVPEVHIFKNEDDYPTPRMNGDSAWFSRGENTVYVNGTTPRVRAEAVYHLTHALVLNSFRRTIGGNGSIAPWAERALAEAFAVAMKVEDGVASWEFGRPIMPLFYLHGRDEKPLPLKRVVAASYGEFNDGSDARRFVAQSHTLLHFLLFHEDGKYRAGVGKYLRSSFKGQSAAVHLEKALGVKLGDLEVEWNAYAREIASK